MVERVYMNIVENHPTKLCSPKIQGGGVDVARVGGDVVTDGPTGWRSVAMESNPFFSSFFSFLPELNSPTFA